MPILTAEERIGTTLAGKYRLDRILGKGGFGVVYAGIHELTGREIATKVLKHEVAEQEMFVKRFLQEARAAAGLNHPNVVDVLDLGKDPDGTVFIVLELLQGQDLTSIIEQRAPLSVDETLSYLLPVMDALAKAHGQGIVHRDLKPDNIFLNVNSKGEMHPKLLDFGIAKVSGSAGGATSTGMVIGTPHYMAPEQARGARDIGPAADVWSMGVVLWQCLTSGVPFDAGTPTGVLGAILTTRAPSVRTLAPGLPPHIAAAIDAALVHEPENRLQNMTELMAALRGEGASLPAMSHAVRAQSSGPSGIMRPTPPTVNMAGTPVPGGYTPMPGMLTPPPMHTPTSYAGEMVAPKSNKSPMIMGVAAVAALLVAGIAVVAGVALWPNPEVAEETPEVASPAPEPVDPPPPVAAAVEPTAVAADAPAAVVEAEPTPVAAAVEPAEPIAEATPRPRNQPRPRVQPPQPRPFGPPVVTSSSRPTPRPRVGTQGAPILR